jgi:hypothetical protein
MVPDQYKETKMIDHVHDESTVRLSSSDPCHMNSSSVSPSDLGTLSGDEVLSTEPCDAALKHGKLKFPVKCVSIEKLFLLLSIGTCSKLLERRVWCWIPRNNLSRNLLEVAPYHVTSIEDLDKSQWSDLCSCTGRNSVNSPFTLVCFLPFICVVPLQRIYPPAHQG